MKQLLNTTALNLFLPFLVIAFTLVGCSDSHENSAATEELHVDVNEVIDQNIEEAQDIFYMMPSPIETASLLQKAGARYNGAILNPVENVGNYELANSKAINLGIYGSDLSYACVFERTQEVMFYISSCKKLADGLGLTKAFDAEMLDRIEQNIDDKDSLMHLISDSYMLADNYLQENDRSNLAALIASGGWIEGLHIATALAEEKPSDELILRIAEQKFSLDHLLEITQTYKGKPEIDEIIVDLNACKKVFDKISIEENTIETTTDKKTGITIVGGTTKMAVSDEILAELTTTINQIRTKYIE